VNPWPHQIRATEDVLSAFNSGERRLALQSPTGGGKTFIMQMLIEEWLLQGKRVALYTNRKMLIEQISGAMDRAGIEHGVRASEYDDQREYPFQICSIQTEEKRTLKKDKWKLHDADRVLVDEAHINNGPTVTELLQRHYDGGASYLMVSATPFGLDHLCDRLIRAGSMAELRGCGALVPCDHFGPDEPDLAALKKAMDKLDNGVNVGEEAMAKIMPAGPKLFGRIWKHFEELNPEHKPTICFAPDVAGSLWIAQEFCKRGVNAAHIDGESVWMNGKFYKNDIQAREDLLEASKDGRIKVLCNRFVLREGIDCPWLVYCILATIFGSLQSYLQAGGRLLRAYPGVERVTVQDHGGNWWRHGSLNEDRVWSLTETPQIAFALRADAIREKSKPRPWRCPSCSRINSYRVCPCGFEYLEKKVGRPVVTSEGDMKMITPNFFKPRTICKQANGPKIWESMYWRSRTEKGAKSFRQAFGLFAQENGWQWPDRAWPYMPTNRYDEFRLVADVPMETLTCVTVHSPAAENESPATNSPATSTGSS
jgi:superfamily II DNA or RNA helicase